MDIFAQWCIWLKAQANGRPLSVVGRKVEERIRNKPTHPLAQFLSAQWTDRAANEDGVYRMVGDIGPGCRGSGRVVRKHTPMAWQ